MSGEVCWKSRAMVSQGHRGLGYLLLVLWVVPKSQNYSRISSIIKKEHLNAISQWTRFAGLWEAFAKFIIISSSNKLKKNRRIKK